MERRLGRGLEGLLGGGGPARAEGAAEASSAPPQGVTQLPIAQVRPNPGQPRRVFESSALEGLRDSIQRHGVLQPICVRPAGRGFEIVAGERRWRAARMAGLAEIPVTVVDEAREDRLLELALVENLQREDLDPLEKARAFRELQQSFGLTQADVADRVGMRRATVANHLRLLDLPAEAQDALVQGLISMGHAKALLGLEGPSAVRDALLRTVKQELSVRQLERLVAGGDPKSAKSSESGGSPVHGGRIPAWVRDLEGRMRDNLGTRVSIQNRTGYKGQVVIKYHDRTELDRICAHLAPPDEIE
jgi:ParB family chromosome partitioning protein